MAQPIRHHYLPIFYLKRWAEQVDGRLCAFSLVRGTVKPKRRGPKGVGWADRIYELSAFPPELRQVMEEQFFSPVDSQASLALRKLEQQQGPVQIPDRDRLAWADFMHSLLVRMPEDVSTIKELWRYSMAADPGGEWEKEYQRRRGPGDLPTFGEYMESIPDDEHDLRALRLLASLIENTSLRRHMSSWAWQVLSVSAAKTDLLTSDRPIVRTNGMAAPTSHMVMPIGPRKC